jgi:hypothetical protein
VAGEIGDWRLVETGSSVDVDGVGDVFYGFCLVERRVESFVLTSWREQQTAVRSESQAPEKRCEGLVEVDGGVADSKSTEAVQAGRVGHDSGQRH